MRFRILRVPSVVSVLASVSQNFEQFVCRCRILIRPQDCPSSIFRLFSVPSRFTKTGLLSSRLHIRNESHVVFVAAIEWQSRGRHESVLVNCYSATVAQEICFRQSLRFLPGCRDLRHRWQDCQGERQKTFQQHVSFVGLADFEAALWRSGSLQDRGRDLLV